jgi:hypothetical protein
LELSAFSLNAASSSSGGSCANSSSVNSSKFFEIRFAIGELPLAPQITYKVTVNYPEG